MQRLPDPSLIPDKTMAKLAAMLWSKVEELVNAVNKLQPTGPSLQDRKIEQLERTVRAQSQALSELERRVRKLNKT